MKPTNEKDSYIYKLTDPRNGEVKYIGATVNPKRRKGQHKRGEFVGKLLRIWSAELRALKLQPGFSIIDICPVEQSSNFEKYWIEYYLEKGCLLLNYDGIKRKYSHTRPGNLIRKNIDS